MVQIVCQQVQRVQRSKLQLSHLHIGKNLLGHLQLKAQAQWTRQESQLLMKNIKVALGLQLYQLTT